jgi:hypothetical protein
LLDEDGTGVISGSPLCSAIVVVVIAYMLGLAKSYFGVELFLPGAVPFSRWCGPAARHERAVSAVCNLPFCLADKQRQASLVR